jgi:hypothetical protein
MLFLEVGQREKRVEAIALGFGRRNWKEEPEAEA